RSAFLRARGTASGERLFNSNMATSTQNPKHLRDRVVQLIDDALFEWDDGVVGDGDPLGAYLRTAFRDVAVADAVGMPQVTQAIILVKRVHLERGGIHHVTRPHELVEHAVVTKHVADILTEEALDALAELLDALDVDLGHAPGAVRRVGWPRPEFLDALLGL